MRTRKVVATAGALGLLATLVLASSALAQQTLTVNIGPGKDEARATGTATLTDIGGGRTRVVLRVTPGYPDMPAHIHGDVCPGVGPVVFPLTNVMAGTSTTEVAASLADIQARGKAINLHKSAAEIGVYVGCGNLAAAPARAGGPALGLVAGALAAAGAGLLGAGIYLRRRRAR